MAYRTIAIKNRCKLSYSLNYLVARGENETRIHLSEISKIIVESTQVSITSSLISEISSRKIKLIFCNEKHNPEAELIPYYGSHNTSLRVKEQTNWDKNVANEIWSVIVKYKIFNQKKVLEKYNHTEKASLLNHYIEEVKFGDSTNREGHSAKVYFNALFGNEFSRSNDSIQNVYLNYGYTILLSMFNREICSRGYLTQIGIHHKNEYNHFNLSCDLMEPFRPIVDDYTLSGILDDENYKSILNNQGSVRVVYNNKEILLENLINIFVGSVIKALNTQNISLIKNFESYEL
jgi:CRISPR-associated endonuclease Cas1 subtype II